MEDLKSRVAENEQSVQQVYVSSQRKMNTVQEDFEALKSNVSREQEYSRIARRAADGLQDEYCKIIHAVATEKQRNLMYIEKAKREFVSEITVMGAKLQAIEKTAARINELEKALE